MLEDLSIFRIITSLISSFAIIYLYVSFKRKNLSIGEFIIWSIISMIILIISINPSMIKLITDYVHLSSNERHDRLILISYFGSFLLLFLVFYYRGKIKNLSERQVKLVQASAISELLENLPNINNKELIIVIPAYNEEENISKIINTIPNIICGLTPFVLVVSDGSNDNTSKISRDNNILTAEHAINLGQCAAYRTGYKIAQILEFKYLVHLDADGQYDPKEIELLVKPLIDESYNFVSGSRLIGYYENKYSNSQIARTFGIFFFNFLLTFILRKKITDSASGFRSIKVDLLSKLNFEQDQFHSTELLIEAIFKKAIFKEVPVSFFKRNSGVSKKPNVLSYGLGFSRAILKTWLRVK